MPKLQPALKDESFIVVIFVHKKTTNVPEILRIFLLQ
jgi:hypothetical protein